MTVQHISAASVSWIGKYFAPILCLQSFNYITGITSSFKSFGFFIQYSYGVYNYRNLVSNTCHFTLFAGMLDQAMNLFSHTRTQTNKAETNITRIELFTVWRNANCNFQLMWALQTGMARAYVVEIFPHWRQAPRSVYTCNSFGHVYLACMHACIDD